MKACALGLRERVVTFIQGGGSKVEAARRLDLARSSVYRIALFPLIHCQLENQMEHWLRAKN